MNKVAFAGVFGLVMVGLLPSARADPSFGFGISFIFGGDVAIGVRVFSDDQPERGALALGLDYKIKAKTVRPTVGVAYLDTDYYMDFSVGYDIRAKTMDYGIGLGLTSGVDAPTIAPPPPPPPAPVGDT